MFYASLTVILLVLGLGLLGFALLAWAFKAGQFDEMDAQAMLPFDNADLRYERPWENPAQRAERAAAYGELIPPKKGEWGEAR